MTASQSADSPSYEQARDELAELVKRLESGGLTLEQSLQVWERGEALAALCEEWLEGARARLAAAAGQPTGQQGGRARPGDAASRNDRDGLASNGETDAAAPF